MCDGEMNIALAPMSVTFLTTDYEDRTPSKIKGIRLKGNKLIWRACADKEHCYYRVFKDGRQIASTVANSIEILDTGADYKVISVDRYGNAGT